jgi:hypothetical protein
VEVKMAEEKKKLKGVVVWFVNLYPDLGQSVEDTMQMVKQMNKPFMDKLTEDGQYVCLLVPTVREATRVEKIDYHAPFPRYMPKSLDIQKVGLKDNEKKKPKQVFGQEAGPSMGGVISLFVNFHPEIKVDPKEVMPLVAKINEEAIQIIAEDGQYQLMIVPTTKEASRVEKVDYEMPFPRFVPKKIESKKQAAAAATKILKEMIDDYEDDDEAKKKVVEDEDDDDDFDEIADPELEEDDEDED